MLKDNNSIYYISKQEEMQGFVFPATKNTAGSAVFFII